MAVLNTGQDLAIGYAGFQILSAMQQSDMIKAQGAVQNQIAQLNAGLAKYDAFRATAAGQTAMAKYQTEISKAQGTATANEAAAHVDPNFGSAAQLNQQNQTTGALNTLEIQNIYREKALGYQRQATGYQTQGSLDQSTAGLRANSTETAGFLNALQTGISASGYGRPRGLPSADTPDQSPSGYSVNRGDDLNSSIYSGVSNLDPNYAGLKDPNALMV